MNDPRGTGAPAVATDVHGVVPSNPVVREWCDRVQEGTCPMGFFSSRPPEASGRQIAPISRDRLVSLFEAQEWKYFIDNEGDLGGNWDANLFYFMIRGTDDQVLHIQSMWHITPDIERLEEVRLFLDTWHRDRLWPKCFHRITDAGRIRVFAEHNVDFEHGATDDQLFDQVQCGLSTTLQFYAALESELGV